MDEENTKLEKKLNTLLHKLRGGLDGLKKVREIYDERVAFDFNSVKLFKHDENTISNILAFFLDTKREHGQKDTFLKEFLDFFKLTEKISSWGNINIIREYQTSENRRIDIVIKIDNFWIGIENKIWASDLQNQLKHYSEYLHKESQGNYCLFYLNPYGREPSIRSVGEEEKRELIGTEKLKIISYDPEIINLVNRFESKCKADNVRAFIKDFNQHLKQKFIGERFMGANEYIQKELENKENWEIALDVSNNIEIVHTKIREKVMKDIKECIPNINISKNDDNYFIIIPLGWEKYQIRLSGRWWLVSLIKDKNENFYDELTKNLKITSNKWTNPKNDQDGCSFNLKTNYNHQAPGSYMLKENFIKDMSEDLNNIISKAEEVAKDLKITL